MSLSVVASGLVTSVGFNAESTCAAMRAGISGIAEGTVPDPTSGEKLRWGKVPLPHWSIALEKLADLVAPAIEECLRAAGEPRDEVPILLGVAEPSSPCDQDGLETRLLEEVEFRLGTTRHPQSKVLPYGHVSAVYGLVEARRVIEARRSGLCVVAGAQSYLRRDVIEAYLEQRRLMTADNSNGFFPGEAGAALLVGAPCARRGPHLDLLGMGTAVESATISSELPLRAEALSDAMKQAREAAGIAPASVAYRITDLTGEHYKFKEAALAAARFEDGTRVGPFPLWHPIEFLGEIGAAILPCILAVALHAGQHGYAPGETALCHVGGEEGHRAALIVRYHAGA